MRIDLVSGRLSPRARAWIDVFGGLFMLLPACAILFWYGWEAFLESWRIGEMSGDAGGLESGEIPPGESRTVVFSEPGAHPFHCTPHPFMTGVVEVRSP